jgi:hypothetical protein
MSVRSALERIADADDSLTDRDDVERQYEMYRKTLEALEDVDADDDEGIAVVTDWIVDRIETTGTRPSSKAVRQRATEFCRNNDYPISDDSWLGR